MEKKSKSLELSSSRLLDCVSRLLDLVSRLLDLPPRLSDFLMSDRACSATTDEIFAKASPLPPRLSDFLLSDRACSATTDEIFAKASPFVLTRLNFVSMGLYFGSSIYVAAQHVNYPSDLVADVKKYGAYDCPLLSYYLFYYARKEKLSYLCGEKRPDKKLRS